jgi:hypothetical protein
MAETINLEFIAQQNDLLMKEVRSFRDDMNVMMEIMRRMEKRVETTEFSVNSISAQLTDMHAYNRRVESRVATLEQQP